MLFLALLRRANENTRALQKVGWWVDGFHTGTATVLFPSLHRGVCDGMRSVLPTSCYLRASVGPDGGDRWAGRMGHVVEHQFGSSHWSSVTAESQPLVFTEGASMTALAKGPLLLSKT